MSYGHATSYLPNRTSVVVLLEAFARNFDPTGSAWKKGQFSPREVQCWTYLMLYLPIFTCHETLRKTVLTVSYSQLFSLHQSIVELVLSWQLMACSFYKWDSGLNLYWNNSLKYPVLGAVSSSLKPLNRLQLVACSSLENTVGSLSIRGKVT